MLRKYLIPVSCAALVAALCVVRVFAAGDIRVQIEEANDTFEAAFARGDAAGVAACYTADGQLLPPGSSTVTGTDAIAAFWSQGMQSGLGSVTLNTIEVEQHGETAIEVGRADIKGKDGQALDTGKYIVIWRRVGGVWKLHRDIWNSSAPGSN